jgi:beta-carotene ketolase (CrtO type)
MDFYDAIVIGAGHNGLTSAAYLGKAGRRVLTLEADRNVGGLAQTDTLVEEAPDYKFSTCALDTLLTNIPRSVVDDLGLEKYGLRSVWPDPWGSYVNPEGASIGLWRDPKRTVAEIAKFSRRDAEQYETFTATLWEAFWVAVPYFQDHPTRPSARTIGEVMLRAAKGHRRLRNAVRMLMLSPDQLIEERFEREEVKAMLASLASWSQLPLDEPGSGGTLGIISAYSKFGCSRPVGGAGEFTKALGAVSLAHGGEIRTNARVARILSQDGQARGVELETGEKFFADQIIGSISPATLIEDLLDPSDVPSKFSDELRSLRVTSRNLAPMGFYAALDKIPDMTAGRPELWQGLMLVAPTIDHVRRAQRDCLNGKMPTDLVLSPVLPSVIDPSLVPADGEGATLYCYLPVMPLELAEGTWADERPGLSDAIISELDSNYAPGIKAATLGTYVKSPDIIGQMVHRGSLYHVDMAMSQLGPFRPTPSMAGYKTPLQGLYHSAAGAHPMGALNGWSGRTTAKLVEKNLRKAKNSKHAAKALTR